jgi:hypothetical protein
MKPYIGGTSAKKIWNGEWLQVYNEIMGITPKEDLTKVFPVQLGSCTEDLNLEFQFRNQGWDITGAGRQWQHHEDEPLRIHGAGYIACHPDAVLEIDGLYTVIDAKHTYPGSFIAGETQEDRLTSSYYWQLTHNTQIVNAHFQTKAEWMILSPIWGNILGDIIKIKVNYKHMAQLREREEAFWWHIINETPPESKEGEAPEPVEIETSELPTLDIEKLKNNNWANEAARILATEESIKENKEAKDDIKIIVNELPVMYGKVTGYGIEVRRNKKNKLSVHIQ